MSAWNNDFINYQSYKGYVQSMCKRLKLGENYMTYLGEGHNMIHLQSTKCLAKYRLLYHRESLYFPTAVAMKIIVFWDMTANMNKIVLTEKKM
jgi:hypothetical protein